MKKTHYTKSEESGFLGRELHTWREILENVGDTPENREITLNAFLDTCGDEREKLLSDDALPFIAHIRATDARLWLSHIAPRIQLWTKEDKTSFAQLLDDSYRSTDSEICKQASTTLNFDTLNAEELRLKDVPETRWIIKGLLPEGLASLAGRPKQGKSWLALNLAISVASGGSALETYEVPTSGSVLFLALEDNESRIKRRMQQLMRQVIPWPSNLKFAIVSPRIGDGFTEKLKSWLETNPNPALIVVDMYTKIAERRTRKSNQSDYDDIYEELAPIQALAYEYHVCVLLVMHLNKTADVEDATSQIMGSTAFAGATVTNLILRRLRGGEPADAILKPNGKDIEDDEDIALVFDNGLWISRGHADIYNQSEQRVQTLQAIYMGKGKETTPKDISAVLGKNPGATRRLLQKLKEDGLVTKGVGDNTYHLTELGAISLGLREKDNERNRNLGHLEDKENHPIDEDLPPWLDSVEEVF